MMIMDLVQYLDEKGYEQIPPAYKALLKNVCKPSSARGLLQVTNYLPLAYLESFCREELPLKDVGRLEELNCVGSQLPVLWPMLNNICNLEKSFFLPPTTSRIVLKLLEIRQNTFVKCSDREDAEYIPYEGEAHPTMCYPHASLDTKIGKIEICYIFVSYASYVII